ncbi:Hexaprenyldihydroxybenzoate methyltransferase, mitochondrial [Coemansia interrupta]|uniref:Ubiquinone biosynthesis O-methyltransferase, mitochondrial n=1 Tax=Coemansia interrupta TaxID=1126814 RepID=A0A9W8HJH5_9FUNG|nr:Hexaprenyldihydroxybenzoate methyltransferase, mitochondrial [Coemansia interrupta]
MPHFTPLVHVRRASVLSHARMQRQQLERTVQLSSASPSEQRKHMRQLLLQQGGYGTRPPRVFHFRHQGALPVAPQALGHLEFVLDERPLDGLTPLAAKGLPQKTPVAVEPQEVMKQKKAVSPVAELDKFRHISASWWDPSGPFKYLHTMNHARSRYMRDILVDLKVLPRGQVSGDRPLAVDVGCGGGLATESLGRMGLRALGIDAALENIEMARGHLEQDPLLKPHVEYRQMTSEQAVDEGLAFACVAALEVIEHVERPEAFVKSLVDLAHPGAPIFLSTMNRTSLAWLVDIVAPEYILGSVPRGTHRLESFVPPGDLSDMLRAAGAQTVDVRGLILDPLCNKCHVVDRHWGPFSDLGVQANYILCAVKNK